MAVNVFFKETIHCSTKEVFSAIVDHHMLTKYFAEKSGEPLEEGRTIEWNFEDYGVKLPIEVFSVDENIGVAFEWDADGKRAVVSISLFNEGDDKCTIEIAEGLLNSMRLKWPWQRSKPRGGREPGRWDCYRD